MALTSSEFWYGLWNIHCLTTRESVELRIDLQDEQINKVRWVYQQFSVDGPDQKHCLHIGQGTGTPPGSSDAMAGSYSLNNTYFTTFDHDNDQTGGESCAVSYRGAWWFRSCSSKWSTHTHHTSTRRSNCKSSHVA